jgi:hypothetical protein
VSFESEQLLLRIRRSGARLTLPTLALGLVCFVYAAMLGRLTEQWQWFTAWGVGGSLILIFWLVPVIRHLTSWVDITTSRLVWRQGLFGQHHQEISLHDLELVETLRGGGIKVRSRSGDEILLKGFARSKKLAQAIREANRG